MEEIKLIDSHCHLYLIDSKFKEKSKNDSTSFEFKSGTDCVPFLNDKRFNGKLYKVVNVTAFFDDYDSLPSLENENVRHTFGFHPHTASEYIANKTKCIDLLDKNLPKMVTVGECGLDYGKYDTYNKNHQKECFVDQLQYAKKYNKPVVIHIRDLQDSYDAYYDGYDILKSILPNDWKIHFHCFSGTKEIAKLYSDTFPNCIFGFTGNITFKKASQDTIETIKSLPLNKIVLETDSPFMTPEPYRSKVCTPNYVSLVLEKIAFIKDVDIKEAGEVIYNTTTSFYDS